LAQDPEAGEEGGEGGEQVEAVFLRRVSGVANQERKIGSGERDIRGKERAEEWMRGLWGWVWSCDQGGMELGAKRRGVEGLSMDSAGVKLRTGESRTDEEDEGRKRRG
jgi:hypothetical protein